ncbi:MAG: hypothetical protein J2P23_09215 [Microlunatus sp.]|nr:hypothetical protein [Microlunatus sp.]
MPDLTRVLQRKVPEVTILFWIIKLLSTALGESTSDYLVRTFDPYLVVLAGFVGFVAVLVLQLRARRYVPWIYWLTVVMVAVFGTMAADVMHVALGVPYAASTAAFAVALAVIVALWFRVERTLSIHTIVTTRRELFYWATVSATFALGTAAGDLLAYAAGLGFLVAGIVFIVIFAIPALGYRIFKLNAVFAFWFAYILTRPIGASFADWTGKSPSSGGLGWGDGPVAAVLAIMIIGLVGYLTVRPPEVDSDVAAARRVRVPD